MSESSEFIDHAADISDQKRSETLQPIISAPTLVCNIAVWPRRERDPQDTKSLKEYTSHLEAWRRDLNDTIARIIDKQDTTDNAKLINTLDRESLQFVPDKKSVDSVPFIDNPFLQFEIVWRGTLIQCLIETHFDYVDFSFFADLSNDRSKGETPDSYRKAAQAAG